MDIFAGYRLENGIHINPRLSHSGQEGEAAFRRSVAACRHDDYLSAISHHHSVPVMTREVHRFLRALPKNAVAVDMGGCWGWHWRNLFHQRSDVTMVIVDFIAENLDHARTVLGNQIGRNIHLCVDNACALGFKDGTFDGYWTVQCFQHIPAWTQAVGEAHRVLKPGGRFVNHTFNRQRLFEGLARMLGRDYLVEGQTGNYYLNRDVAAVQAEIERVFARPAGRRYSEVLFELGFRAGISAGRDSSAWGAVDALLTDAGGLFAPVARQVGLEIEKAG